MLMHTKPHPLSPRLDHSPESLPREAYLSHEWFTREMSTVFRQQWVCVGRAADVTSGTMRRYTVGAASVIVCNTDNKLSAFHNVCRHRGSELCRGEQQKLGKLITCPYHAWAYAAGDGRLVSTAFANPTPDFDKAAHGLLHVAHRVWDGFLFLNTSATPGELWSDVPLSTLDNWPMESLVTGYRWTKELECNWKIFWENYSECLHCPGIHPELCDMVPVYGKGIMGQSEALGWTPEEAPDRNLKPEAETWTKSGKPCGPVFEGLTEAERQAGYTFVTLWPSVYIVAHVDYVRSVRLEPLSPERTRLVAEWYFPQATLDQPGFNAESVASFSKLVMTQDGEAAEMNQRGLRSPAYSKGRLMPEEYEIHRFHEWLLHEMEGAT
jgi:glycine betaine catabolism A